jgi:hypothetical protein
MLVSDPIFSTRTYDGTLPGGLFDLLSRVSDGALIDLPAMQPHQRGPVVTALAIIMTTLSRHAPAPLTCAAEWGAAWRAQVGPDALRLIAPPTDTAFFQSAIPGADLAKGSSLTVAEVDALFVGQGHEVKALMTAAPEQWAYALIASTWRQYGGLYRYGDARSGLLVVLPSDGRTLASEVQTLARAYVDMPPGEVGREASPTSAADHLLWTRPWPGRPHTLAEVPHPFIDARCVRLVETSKRIGAVDMLSHFSMVDTGTGDIADPHVPLLDGAPYKVVKKRSFDHRVEHAAIAGSDKVARPRILDLTSGFRSVRISALGTDPPGKTNGYWESRYAITSARSGFRLGPPTRGDRVSDLSKPALAVLDTAGRSVLWPALTRLYGSGRKSRESDQKTPRRRQTKDAQVAHGMERMRSYAGHRSLQLVLDLAPMVPDAEAEQKAMHRLAADAVLAAWTEASASCVEPLWAAEAESYLRNVIKELLGGIMVRSDVPPALARQVYAVLGEIAAQVAPSDRAQLRSNALSEPPMAAWLALAATPRRQADDPQCSAVWLTVIQALGSLRQGGPPAGRRLAESEFPENRMSALLAATGPVLVDLIGETVRWLLAKEVKKTDLSTLATLGVADALGDLEARTWAKRHIALDWARVVRRDAA